MNRVLVFTDCNRIVRAFIFFFELLKTKPVLGYEKEFLHCFTGVLCVYLCNHVRNTSGGRRNFQGPVSSGDLRDAQATRLNIIFPINITNFSVNFCPKSVKDS